jgi:hypothetical protein
VSNTSTAIKCCSGLGPKHLHRARARRTRRELWLTKIKADAAVNPAADKAVERKVAAANLAVANLAAAKVAVAAVVHRAAAVAINSVGSDKGES